MLKDYKCVILRQEGVKEVRFYRLDKDLWCELIDGKFSPYAVTDDIVDDTWDIWESLLDDGMPVSIDFY